MGDNQAAGREMLLRDASDEQTGAPQCLEPGRLTPIQRLFGSVIMTHHAELVLLRRRSTYWVRGLVPFSAFKDLCRFLRLVFLQTQSFL